MQLLCNPNGYVTPPPYLPCDPPSQVVLLFSEPLQLLPAFGSVWRAILECLGSAMAGCAGKSEILAEAIPEALKNMLLVLQTRVGESVGSTAIV